MLIILYFLFYLMCVSFPMGLLKTFKLPFYLTRVPLGGELKDRLTSEFFFYLNAQFSLGNRNIIVMFPNRFFYGPSLAFGVAGFACLSVVSLALVWAPT